MYMHAASRKWITVYTLTVFSVSVLSEKWYPRWQKLREFHCKTIGAEVQLLGTQNIKIRFKSWAKQWIINIRK